MWNICEISKFLSSLKHKRETGQRLNVYSFIVSLFLSFKVNKTKIIAAAHVSERKKKPHTHHNTVLSLDFPVAENVKEQLYLRLVESTDTGDVTISTTC